MFQFHISKIASTTVMLFQNLNFSRLQQQNKNEEFQLTD